MDFGKLDALLDRILEHDIPGNDCIVCVKGVPVYRRTAGFADRMKTRPLAGNERYQIFSCSKLVTCTAALQLFEKGLFGLDDELWHYLPEFREMTVRTPGGEIRPAQRKITMRHLFTMTAGFSYDLNSKAFRKAYDDTCGACPTRKTISYLPQEPLLFEPGTGWYYSLCHDVLAAAVEVISGVPFNDYVKQNIFDVLGMPQSTFLLPASEFDTLLPLYREEKEYPLTPLSMLVCGNLYRPGPLYASGGAGCVSTLEDFNKLLQALCDGEKLLRRATIDLMRTDQLDDKLREAYARPGYGYGLGVRCPPATGQGASDFGWGGAAGAYFAIFPERQTTVLYMQHVTNAASVKPLRLEIPKVVLECLD